MPKDNKLNAERLAFSILEAFQKVHPSKPQGSVVVHENRQRAASYGLHSRLFLDERFEKL